MVLACYLRCLLFTVTVPIRIRNSQPVKSQVNPVDTVKEIRTNAPMEYIVEVYEGVTGVITPGRVLRCRQNSQSEPREELEAYFFHLQ